MPLPAVRVSKAEEWSGPLVALSDETGRATLERWSTDGHPPAARASVRPFRADEVTAWTEGRAVVVIDSVSTAPWAREVPLRPVAVLSGRVEGARPGEDLSVVVRADSVTWPPRTGLERTDPRLRGTIGEDGRFSVEGVPAHVPLTVWLGAGTYSGGLLVDSDLVLRVDEPSERFYERPDDPVKSKKAVVGEYQAVSAVAIREEGRAVLDAWFEIVPGGRYRPHKVGGGRWHVHGNRPCDHIEAPAGRRVVVARSSAGLIGAASVEIPEEAAPPRVRVEVALGGLVRLDAARLAEGSRVRFVHGGLGFVETCIVPREIRYELVPAGEVLIEIEREGQEALRRKIEAKAGEIVRLDL